jgi:hypothetical protein
MCGREVDSTPSPVSKDQLMRSLRFIETIW